MKKLSELQQDMYQERQLENRIRALEKRQNQLEDKVRDLRDRKAQEEEDVEKLNGRSLTALFYKISGKRQEMLDKEQLEAYEAAVKYDAAVRELNVVKQNLDALRNEKMELRGSEERYRRALEERVAELRKQKDEVGETLTRMEARKGEMKKQLREIGEAKSAGRSALAITERILNSLDSAESWSAWDLVGSGGLITDLVKYEHLDEAQSEVEDLQVALGRFRTELMDISLPADLDVRVDGFLKFADFFFDGLLVDWMVWDRIKESIEQVHEVRRSIDKILTQLGFMETRLSVEMQKLDHESEQLVLQEERTNV